MVRWDKLLPPSLLVAARAAGGAGSIVAMCNYVFILMVVPVVPAAAPQARRTCFPAVQRRRLDALGDIHSDAAL